MQVERLTHMEDMNDSFISSSSSFIPALYRRVPSRCASSTHLLASHFIDASLAFASSSPLCSQLASFFRSPSASPLAPSLTSLGDFPKAFSMSHPAPARPSVFDHHPSVVDPYTVLGMPSSAAEIPSSYSYVRCSPSRFRTELPCLPN